MCRGQDDLTVPELRLLPLLEVGDRTQSLWSLGLQGCVDEQCRALVLSSLATSYSVNTWVRRLIASVIQNVRSSRAHSATSLFWTHPIYEEAIPRR